MSTPAGLMDRLPAAVLLQLAQSFLTDEDAQALGATCMAMPSLLRHYAVKQRVSLRSSLIEDGNFAAGSRRFGVATAVRIDRRACEAPELQRRLERLPRRVRTVHVAQEVFLDRNRSYHVRVFYPPSQLRAVLLHLPAHVEALVFERALCGYAYEDRDMRLMLLPFSQWRLPENLKELRLPIFCSLDEEGQGAEVQLPPALTSLTLGSALNHSLAQLRLPSSLRSLHLGRRWTQPLAHWPSLPDGLTELSLSDKFDRSLAALQLPASLRVLRFGSAWTQPPSAWPALPEGVEELHLPNSWPHSFAALPRPRAFQRLHIEPRIIFGDESQLFGDEEDEEVNEQAEEG